MEERTNMNGLDNEKFLTAVLDKTVQKLNVLNAQNIVLETQLKFANDKILALEKELNDSTSKQTESN